MSTPASPNAWTYSEYARFPDDGGRYEVVDGEVLVTPAPTPYHQRVLARLLIRLDEYVERHGLGIVLPEVDVLFAAGHFLRPDLVFVPAARRHGISDRGVEVPPGLVVEVQSPTSEIIDRVQKPTPLPRLRHSGILGAGPRRNVRVALALPRGRRGACAGRRAVQVAPGSRGGGADAGSGRIAPAAVRYGACRFRAALRDHS